MRRLSDWVRVYENTTILHNNVAPRGVFSECLPEFMKFHFAMGVSEKILHHFKERITGTGGKEAQVVLEQEKWDLEFMDQNVDGGFEFHLQNCDSLWMGWFFPQGSDVRDGDAILCCPHAALKRYKLPKITREEMNKGYGGVLVNDELPRAYMRLTGGTGKAVPND